MVTLAQIKAARALLGWTQEKLAQASGLSLPAINNLERGLTSPRKDTLSSIARALENSGIEFIDTSGVRQKTPDLSVEIIEGPEWLKRYDADIISQLNSTDDEIIQFSCDERQWLIYGSSSNHHYIDHRSKVGFRERILLPDTCSFVSNLRRVYRTLPTECFAGTSWQCYGNRTSFIVWESRRIVLLKSAAHALTQRRLFDNLWAQGKAFTDGQWSKLEKWGYSPTSSGKKT